jgi:hypothetical protein
MQSLFVNILLAMGLLIFVLVAAVGWILETILSTLRNFFLSLTIWSSCQWKLWMSDKEVAKALEEEANTPVLGRIKSIKCKVCKCTFNNDKDTIDLGLNTCPDNYHVGQECGLVSMVDLVRRMEAKMPVRRPVAALLQVPKNLPANEDIIARMINVLERSTYVKSTAASCDWKPISQSPSAADVVWVDEVHVIRIDKNGNVHREKTQS